MQRPDNRAGALTERIMLAIATHIRRDPPPQENRHYNRAYEAIFRILYDDIEWRGDD